MSKAITYNLQGMILSNILAPIDMMEMQVQEGEILLMDVTGDSTTEYVLDEVVVSRPIQNTVLDKLTLNADGVDSIIISEAPNGFFSATNSVKGTGASGEIIGSDSFSTTIPGIYKIKIESFPYLDFEATIEAI